MKKFYAVEHLGWHTVYHILGLKLNFRYLHIHKDEVNLIFGSDSGIGNRIFGIVNAYNWFSPKTINIYWDTKNWVKCALNEIFDINFPCIINQHDNMDFINNQNKNIFTIYGPSQKLKNNSGKYICFKYNDISNNDREHFAKIFKMIQPSIQVKKRIDTFTEDFDYTVQVRNNPDWNKFGRDESLELFFEKIREIPEGSKIYLSAMNKEVSEMFKNEFPDKIYELPNKDYSSMIDAAADLYIMSQAKNAIYSYGSTFGELAFWLGGANQHVTTVGSDINWK